MGVNQMNIDLGYLNKVVLEEIEPFTPEGEGFAVVYDGYTESGIRVHGVLDQREYATYPTIWRNAIMIKVN
jgi:hypothetical protein